MCTVVFIPEKNKNIFASLRDENPARPAAVTPVLVKKNNNNFLAPQDPLGGGTWLGVNETETVVILLNGGFVNHVRQKQYKHSRGLIVTALLASTMPIIEWELLSLQDIEPFSLVVWSDRLLFHMVWDGQQKFRFKLDATKPHIFSSSTLYDENAKKNRHILFQNWLLKNPSISKNDLLHFFNSIPDRENGFIINRMEKTKTVSFTFIVINNNSVADLCYDDFQKNKASIHTISMKKTFYSNLLTLQ